jgi:hypothetical protein
MQSVIARVSSALQNIDVDAMTKEMATTTVGMMRDRIHGKGLASDGSGIGTYSAGYMNVRMGNFRNSGRVSRGKNKGKAKNAGTHVRGASKGSQRPKYNRSASTDVILSLTREMENDFGAFKNSDNNWSIGFIRNPNRGTGIKFTHVDIAQNAERIYGKHIYSLSGDEQTAIDLVLDRYLVNALKNQTP